MTTVIENDLNDLQELKDLIKDIKNDLEKNQIKLESKLEGIDKRLESLEIINRTAVIGILLSLFGIIATAVSKYLFFS